MRCYFPHCDEPTVDGAYFDPYFCETHQGAREDEGLWFWNHGVYDRDGCEVLIGEAEDEEAANG